MDSRNADILQIKKYLEGKLDTRAMYELERRALDDPFLMDAMEGYEAAGKQNKAAAELTANLQRRLQKPHARIISFSTLAMAASVLVVLSVGGWWILSGPAAKKADVVANVVADKTSVSPSPMVDQPQISIKKDSLLALNTPKTVIRSSRRTAPYYNGTPMPGNDVSASSDETAEIASSAAGNNGFLAESPVAMRSRAKTDSVPLNEMLVMGYEAQRKKDAAQGADKALAGKVAGLSVANAPAAQGVIKGKVVSAQDGQPLPGVAVRVGNSSNAAVTDQNGLYNLKIDSINSNISFNYPGFQKQTFDAGNSGINNVRLEPETTSLSEVVVVGYGRAKPVTTAQPRYGWDNYQKYLNANSVSPNGKNKNYRVSFTVDKDGSLSNFKVNSADNDAAGQKAIQLIKNGPEWVGSPKGEAKKITVTVKFRKAEKQ
ncbi:carboxypeptidase-like regulatory domain-containing protein [Mucilaginibacter calamicampi]|uniref:Carboxypeptidase-like regulatory domain-containing protein n=1 Tax=Mucilaginibacter calamicampi TaxID=1302352 RepID=A0ABW2YZN9_9SPHI